MKATRRCLGESFRGHTELAPPVLPLLQPHHLSQDSSRARLSCWCKNSMHFGSQSPGQKEERAQLLVCVCCSGFLLAQSILSRHAKQQLSDSPPHDRQSLQSAHLMEGVYTGSIECFYSVCKVEAGLIVALSSSHLALGSRLIWECRTLVKEKGPRFRHRSQHAAEKKQGLTSQGFTVSRRSE